MGGKAPVNCENLGQKSKLLKVQNVKKKAQEKAHGMLLKKD
jgi:hypothetical protein